MDKIFQLLILFFSSFCLHAQEVFDLRFVINSFDCETATVLIDVEIKANAPGSEFRLSDQNYRFSFDASQLANPSIDSELDVSGLITNTGPMGFTLYSSHTLTGSVANLVSLNIGFNAGDGLLITDQDWVGVSRLEFDILNNSNCFDISFHDSNTFPPTFIGGVMDDGTLFTVGEGEYLDLVDECIDCELIVPVELTYFKGTSKGCDNILAWETLSEVNASHFEIFELSQDGNTFTSIGKVDAFGTSNTLRTYGFIDEDVVNSLSYYKLKQVDLNGDFKFYNLITVQNNCITSRLENTLKVFPNPIGQQDILNIELGANGMQTIRVRIQNLHGQILIDQLQDLSEDENTIQVNTSNLIAGQFIIHIYDSQTNLIQSTHFIKTE